jgi:hypothetical protein
MQDANIVYWAARPIEEIAAAIEEQFETYKKWGRDTGYFDRVVSAYRAFYGFDTQGTLRIERNEDDVAIMKVNQLKALIRRIHIMVTENKLAYQPRAKSTDAKSQLEADLAKGITEYYGAEKHMHRTLSDGVLGALIQLEYWVHAPWSLAAGYELTADGQQVIKSGDQAFETYGPLDVAKATATATSPWKIIRQKVNKFDEAALHPEFATEILASSIEPDPQDLGLVQRANQVQSADADDDHVHKFILYHDRTPAMPQGRRVEIIAGQVLSDGELKYVRTPLFRISAGDVLGQAFGDSPTISLLPLQAAMDALFSAIITNNLNNSNQLIHSADPNLTTRRLGDGQTLVTSASPPVGLNLTNSGGESYKVIDLLVNHQRLLSGVNDTVVGAPGQEVKTAGGQALMLAQAISFVSDLAQSYAQLGSDVASALISNIQQFQTEEMTAYIVGESRAGEIKKFKATDIMQVDRIVCDPANPLIDTLTGRDQQVQQWIQLGIQVTPQQLIEFYRTGNIDSATEDDFSESIRIRECCELIRKGQKPSALITDNHQKIILGVKGVMTSEEARSDPNVLNAFIAFVTEHLDLMRSMPPDLAAILNGQPLPPAMPGPPGAPPQPQVGGVDVPNLPEGTPPQTAANYQQGVEAPNTGAA